MDVSCHWCVVTAGGTRSRRVVRNCEVETAGIKNDRAGFSYVSRLTSNNICITSVTLSRSVDCNVSFYQYGVFSDNTQQNVLH
jgi:hypothetical protein